MRPVATRPSTPPTDSITGLDPAARTIAYPGVITSESPATQSFSFRSGVNATFLGVAGGVGFGFDVEPVGGFGVVRGVVVGDSGRAISVSISSLPDRPMSAWTPMRGRSSSRAWLTSASGPVKAIVTSRDQPSGLL